MDNKNNVIKAWAELGAALGVNRAQIQKAIDHNAKYRVAATRTVEKLPEKLTLQDIKPEAHDALIAMALRQHRDVKAAASALGVPVDVVETFRRSQALTPGKLIRSVLTGASTPLTSREIMQAVEAQFDEAGRRLSPSHYRNALYALKSSGVIKAERPAHPNKNAKLYSLA